MEADIWERRENLENTKELVEEFEKEYGEETKKLRRQELEEEEKEFSYELLRKFIAKLIYRWKRKRYGKRKREKMRGKLELMEKFLGTKNLEERAML